MSFLTVSGEIRPVISNGVYTNYEIQIQEPYFLIWNESISLKTLLENIQLNVINGAKRSYLNSRWILIFGEYSKVREPISIGFSISLELDLTLSNFIYYELWYSRSFIDSDEKEIIKKCANDIERYIQDSLKCVSGGWR